MDRIRLRLPSLPPDAIGGVADLLRDWLPRASDGASLADIHIRSDGEEAVGTLCDGPRRVDVRLEHEADDRWAITASTLVEPESEPIRGWSVLAGFLMFLLGVMLSLGWSDQGPLALVGGLALSVLLGLLVGLMTHRRHADRRRTAVTRDQGGQAPADELLARIADVARGDPRAELLAP